MKDNRKLPTSMGLIARILVGAYLAYLAWQLLSGMNAADNPILNLVFGVIFIIAGIGAAILGLRDMVRGYYVGGPMDLSGGEETESDQAEEKKEAPAPDAAGPDAHSFEAPVSEENSSEQPVSQAEKEGE